MIRAFKIGILCGAVVPVLSLVSCDEEETVDLPNQMVQDILKTGNLSQKDKEIVAHQLTRPLGDDLRLGITPVLFQLRCGLIGLVKVRLVKGSNSIEETIYYGTKWIPSKVEMFWTHFRDKSRYNDFILAEQKWALPVEEAEVTAAYKLTPNRIIYDQQWNPVELTNLVNP